MNNPTLFDMPIAQTGDKHDIFTNSGSGAMTIPKGFPSETSKPLSAGGVAPTREDFNGAFYAISSHLFLTQKGFIFKYDSGQDYYQLCMVNDGGTIYICIADMVAGTIQPSLDVANTYWKSLKDFLGASSGDDKKTSSSQLANTKLFLVGARTQDTDGVTTYSNDLCYIGTDNCLYSKGKKVGSGNGHAPGEIFGVIGCSDSYAPEGSVACDGSTYDKTTFPDFYADYLIGGKLLTCSFTEYQSDLNTYGQCAKWGLATSSNQFRVPMITDGSFLEQAQTAAINGKSYNAGLPNITGHFSVTSQADYAGDGAFENKGALYSCNSSQYEEGNGNIYAFDASKGGSTIYGGSTTVQPKAVTVRYFVALANEAINSSAIDWSTWMAALANKANVDFTNVTEGLGAEKVHDQGTTALISLSEGRIFYCTGDTITLPTVQDGVTLTCIVTAAAINWSTNIVWKGGSAPTLTSNTDMVTFIGYNGTWYGA